LSLVIPFDGNPSDKQFLADLSRTAGEARALVNPGAI